MYATHSSGLEFTINTFVNDKPVSSVNIDTTVVGTSTIRYESTDADGRTGRAERLVVVFDPYAPIAPVVPIATTTSSQSATTTASVSTPKSPATSTPPETSPPAINPTPTAPATTTTTAAVPINSASSTSDGGLTN